MIDTLVRAYRLKDEPRRGWVLRGVAAPESVADHSWGTALLCLLFADEAGVDGGEAARIAVLHDLAEALTGDVAHRLDPADREMSLEEKARREVAAMDVLLPEGVPASAAAREAWEAYEERRGPEAVFARDMNLIDMCLQALIYEADGRHAYPEGLGEFFASADARLETQVGRRLFGEIEARYRRAAEG